MHYCDFIAHMMFACLLAWTDHLLKILNERAKFTKIELMHSVPTVGDHEGLLPECSVGYLELKLKYTWQLPPCLLQIIDGRLPTGSTNFNHDSGWDRVR